MILYAVEWHSAPLPQDVDEGDLDWTTWPGHDNYTDEDEANEAAREFDAAFDGACVHRVVARRVASPGLARTRASSVVATRATSSPDDPSAGNPSAGNPSAGNPSAGNPKGTPDPVRAQRTARKRG
jgi:hypothetical protein